jgi:hypothetical protein
MNSVTWNAKAMKRSAYSILVLCLSTGVLSGQVNQPYEGPVFFLTSKTCDPNRDLRAVAMEEFGPQAGVADWLEIKAIFGSKPELLLRFMTACRLGPGRTAWVTVGGKGWFEPGRHYHVERHDGRVPNDWLVHDHIQGHTLDLGSWEDPCPVLVRIAPDPPLHYKMTARTYSPDADLSAACVSEFGPGSRMADWNEIKKEFGGSIVTLWSFCHRVGLTKPGSSAFVTRDNQRFFSGTRHYYVERHMGEVPADWLVHDTIRANYLDLGSWTTPRAILVKIP